MGEVGTYSYKIGIDDLKLKKITVIGKQLLD